MSLLKMLAQKLGLPSAQPTTAPTIDELGTVVRALREKVEDKQFNTLLEGAIAGMPTEREAVVYAKGGDIYLGRMKVKSVDSWRRFGRQKGYKHLYKGFAYQGNERVQVIVFDNKVWDSQEIQKRKANGFLGIRFYDLTSGEERQMTEARKGERWASPVGGWESDKVREVKDDFYDEMGREKYLYLGIDKRMPIHYKKAKEFFAAGDLFNAKQHARAYLSFVPEGYGTKEQAAEMEKIRDAEVKAEQRSDASANSRWALELRHVLRMAEVKSTPIKAMFDGKEHDVTLVRDGGRYHFMSKGENPVQVGPRFGWRDVKSFDASTTPITIELSEMLSEDIDLMWKPGEQSGDHEDLGVNDVVKVKFDVLRKMKGALPPYESLVRTILNHGGGSARILRIRDGEAQIIGSEMDKHLGPVMVPLAALRKARAFVAGAGQTGSQQRVGV